MRPASRRTDHVSGGLQPVLGPGVGPLPPMLGLPALVEVFHRPACVLALIQRHHLEGLIDWDRSGRRSAQPTILQSLNALRFIAGAPPPKRAFRHAQHLRRLRHRQISPLSSRIQLLKSHLSHLL